MNIDSSLILNSEFNVSSAETDMEARLRLGALVNLLIQSAINSADKLGFGFGGIRNQNLFWVLSRLNLEIYRPMNWYEKVYVETWPKSIEKILYIRDFIVKDKDHNITAKSTSGWLAVDMTNKRSRKVDSIHAELLARLKNKHALTDLPLKLESVDNGEEFDFKPEYFDMDLNKHLTSTRYIDRMMDSFPIEFHKNNYPSLLYINYLKETLPGDILRFTRKLTEDGSYAFEGKNINKGVIAFRGKIKF